MMSSLDVAIFVGRDVNGSDQLRTDENGIVSAGKFFNFPRHALI